MNTVRFARQSHTDFSKVLRKRVNAYFKDNKISKYANVTMVLKTVFMIALFFVPYALIISGVLDTMWLIFLGYFIIGFGMAGIGLSVMHDANHGAYSKREWVNKLLSRILNLIGGFSLNWRLQHNVLHHTFTNIDGLDEDIAPGDILRFSPHAPRKKFHRFQHIYAWPLYAIMTLMWIFVKDFKQLNRYNKIGLLKQQNVSYGKQFVNLLLWKSFYHGYMLVLPIMILDQPWWVFIIGIFILHIVCGLWLAMIFQPAHVVPHNHFPLPKENGNIENEMFIHQLETTANFAPKAKIFGWYVGGLNYQVEHHLFPHICHVHYPKIARIVKETAEEYGIKYHSFPTFGSALVAHKNMLKMLGTQDHYQPAV